MSRAGRSTMRRHDRGSPNDIVHSGTATMQSDVYALGVLLYQTAAGDFSRSLAPGPVTGTKGFFTHTCGINIIKW